MNINYFIKCADFPTKAWYFKIIFKQNISISSLPAMIEHK